MNNARKGIKNAVKNIRSTRIYNGYAKNINV